MSEIVKVISLWEPWAYLWAIDAKGLETRSWATTYRGPIAIHAAKKDPKAIMQTLPLDIQRAMFDCLYEKLGIKSGALEKLPLGCIIATADLVDCHLMTAQYIANQTKQERLFGDWSLGRYAWEVVNKKVLDKPIPVRGKQGLWNWEPPASPLITTDTLDLCKPCAEARKLIEPITLVRGGNDNKITCVDCGRRRYGATYKKELAP